MEWVYWVLMLVCAFLSLTILSIECRSRFWLGGYMGFLSAYLGLILLDAQVFYISPVLYFLSLAIIYLPGPLLLGYISHISTRSYVGPKDFVLCALPLMMVLVAGDMVGGSSLLTAGSEADYQKDHYIALFNVLSAMAGIQTLAYLLTSLWLVLKLRKDWVGYQSKTLPQSWFRMVQVIGVIMIGTILQVASAFLNPAGDKISIGDIGFILVTGYFIALAITTARRNWRGEEDSEELILQQQDYIPLAVVADLTPGSTSLYRVTDSSGDALAARDRAGDSDQDQNTEMERMVQQLSDAMDNQALYLQEDLSLSSLAGFLRVTTHKLSDCINSSFNKSFYEYINDFRVKYAAQQLIEKPEESITDIFYAAGFTTKSTFYSYFKKSYGCTPTQYRKNMNSAE